jgi:hypothetical protein
MLAPRASTSQAPLIEGIYPNLYRRRPLGLALRDHLDGVGVLYGRLAAARPRIDGMVPGAEDEATTDLRSTTGSRS